MPSLRRLAPLAALALPAVAPAQTVEVLPNWRRGETWAVTYEKSERKWEAGAPVQDDSVRTRFAVTVTDSTADGYRLRWAFTDHDDNQPASAAVEAAMAADPAGVLRLVGDGLVVRTDPDGRYEGLANRDDLARIVQRAVAPLFDSLRATVPAERRAAFDALAARAQSPAFVEQAMAGYLASLHELNGYAYDHGTTRALADTLDASVLGARIPTTGTVKALVLPGKPAHLQLRYDRTVAYDDFLDVLRTTMTAHGTLPPDFEAEAETLRAAFRFVDTSRWLVSAETGRVVTFEFDRHLVLGENEQRIRQHVRLH